MSKETFKPGELLKMLHSGGKKQKKAMKIAGIKTSGSFHGKSNTLGHGGRAAQLKARGVPGGVIGNLARAAHAAPGQENYHGKKAKHMKKKVAAPQKEMLGMAMKKSQKAATHTHIHVHLHKGSDSLVGTSEENKERSPMRMKGKKDKHYKKAEKHYKSSDNEDKDEGDEDGQSESSSAVKCKICGKKSHKTSEHKGKHYKKAHMKGKRRLSAPSIAPTGSTGGIQNYNPNALSQLRGPGPGGVNNSVRAVSPVRQGTPGSHTFRMPGGQKTGMPGIAGKRSSKKKR